MGEIAELKFRYNKQTNYYLYDIKWGDGYNYLAIGNSLTLIEGDWGRGICSTLPNNDYFGLVKKYLNEHKTGPVTTHRFNYYVWEVAKNRDSVLDLADSYISDKLDLVTIQLGENVYDFSSYKDDLKKLVLYIQSHAPKAKIIIIDDFWNDKTSIQRKETAEDLNIAFADLRSIRGNNSYQSREGVIVKKTNGGEMSVPKEAETHPNDDGFKYIAEKIISLL